MPAPLLSPDAGLDPRRDGYADSVHAVLLGGALGDALGVPEVPAPGAGAGQGGAHAPTGRGDDGPAAPLRITAAAQLTLYTLDGLQEVVEWAHQGHSADETACLWLAYLRWLRTQDEPDPAEAPRPLPRPIDDDRLLHAVRDPDTTVLEALRSGRMGEVERPVQPDALGPGAVLRSAPFGLLPHVGWRTLAPLAVNGAALTHGHPEAQTAAAVHGFVVHAAVRARQEGAARPVAEAVAAARAAAEHLTRPVAGTVARIDDVVRAAGHRVPATGASPRTEGTGPTAPEVLAGGLGAALRAEAELAGSPDPQAVFRRAVALGTEDPGHGAGAVAGAVTGAALGTAALPPPWCARLDARDAVSRAARRWLREVGATSGA
ncbi:ADP-ribosylglycohydrolase family protein [Kocuria sp. CPCC 205268]|uniref:ADP-ribosylglycohydrolase family protein n=1 Tax=Kocuria oxytropis TaxID=3058913 RepID=UPI0034D7B69A